MPWGVQLSVREIRPLGRVIIGGALLQIALTLAAGAALMVLLGFETRSAFVLGAVVAISSTMVFVKLMEQAGEQDALHGRIGLGWMIIQDLATIALFIMLPALSGGELALPILVAMLRTALSEYNLILATTVASVVAAPWMYRAVRRYALAVDGRLDRAPDGARASHDSGLTGEVVVLGGGRVGATVAAAAVRHVDRYVVVEQDEARRGFLESVGATVVSGDAANPEIFARVLTARTRLIIVALPDPVTAHLAVERSRRLAPGAAITARATSEASQADLEGLGTVETADHRLEVGLVLAESTLLRLGVAPATAEVGVMRRRAYGRAAPS